MTAQHERKKEEAVGQTEAHFLEMAFLERNIKHGVKSRFLPRFVETS